jgi:response regulator RpfG family c-di-GMP phosphodiesterase
MLRNFLAQLSLFSRFTLISFCVTFAVAASLAWLLESALEDDILKEVAENTAGQASTVLDQTLTRADFRDALQGERYGQIDALIHNSLLNSNIVRIKLWNRAGLLIYADDQSLVGKTYPPSETLDRALLGEIATEISTLEDDENAGERGQYPELFEIYVPLRLAESGEIVGVYEVYYDFTKLQPRLARIRYLAWGGMGTGFLLIFGVLSLLVRNASRDLAQSSAENQALLAAEQAQRERAEILERVSRALSENLDLRSVLGLICRESVELFKTHAAFLWLLEGGELVGFAAHGPGADQFIGMRFPIYDPQLLAARVARERKSILVHDARHSAMAHPAITEQFRIQSMVGIALIKGKRLLGALMIVDSENPRRFSEEDIKTATVFGSHAALAIDNAQLFAQSSLHLANERALREIDSAITSGPDLTLTLSVVLYQTRTQLNVDAATILLLDQDTQMLECFSQQGFETDLIARNHIQLGAGRAGNAALERRVFGRAEIESPNQIPDRLELITRENFCAYFIAPLVTMDKLLGALEIYHRSPLKINVDWLKFLEALAGQAAIAVQNATMFTDLQRSNEELALAYEAAIEGWARALELRDKETEGHTRRVTDTTIKLAQAMGITDPALRHMYRGALLHDIGKMGIPDSILRKPEALTPEELDIMQQHPAYAYELLKGISYLREDLDIPYCHHEKWDGTGYPRGLKGEEIPLSARIFAVADVYDALTSDRPYRKGWGHERTLEYIQLESGSHFDPEVVEAFLKLTGQGDLA